MENIKDYSIIDFKQGNVTDGCAIDKVMLKGVYLSDDSKFVEDLRIEVISADGKDRIIKKIPYSGYSLKLFLGDFTGNGREEIMVRGTFGGSGNFAIASVYEYKDGELIEIFSPTMFDDKYKFKARYLDNYRVEVISETLKQKYIIDISLRDKRILDMIYESDGTVKEGQEPAISGINEAFPINFTFKDNYDLFTQQRIIGVSNADTIAIIQNFVELKDSLINVFYGGVMVLGEEYNNKN